MSRMSSVIAAVALAVGLPAQAQQPARVLEFGITGGVSHHDFHYRYPGEGRWQDPLGLRLDARLRAGGRSAIGIAVVADRYVYSEASFSGVCLSACSLPLPPVSGAPLSESRSARSVSQWRPGS